LSCSGKNVACSRVGSGADGLCAAYGIGLNIGLEGMFMLIFSTCSTLTDISVLWQISQFVSTFAQKLVIFVVIALKATTSTVHFIIFLILHFIVHLEKLQLLNNSDPLINN
jgi:hypothetical protein